ncbi:MAG: Rrf2 family transcriptional regulator [Oscillospiraceae bacterium]
MLINKETDYALRIFRVLADGERLSVPELCRQTQITTSFAHKIVHKLTAGGYLEVTRGSAGGCKLSADLNAFTLYDVMETMGDRSQISACTNPEYLCSWRAKNHRICAINCNLLAIQSSVDDLLRQHTVASLVGCHKQPL